MRTLTYNRPWDITVDTRPDPRPGPGEVLIRVVATGICGSDIHGFSGANGRRFPGQVMGHETVGRLVELGAGVEGRDDLRVGGAVTVNPVISCGECRACASGAEQACEERRVVGVNPDIVSAFAELLVVPAANTIALPESMPIELGALVEPLAVGFHAARRGHCSPSDAVLVLGGGPIGQACVLGAQRLGAERIVVSEPNEHRRALVNRLGATAVDPSQGGLPERVGRLIGGRATLVIDAVGTASSLADALGCAAFGARIVLVGMNARQLELPAYSISTEERVLVGSFAYAARDFIETAAWVGEAPAVLGALIDARVDMDEAPNAFMGLAQGELQASKVLVFPHGAPPG